MRIKEMSMASYGATATVTRSVVTPQWRLGDVRRCEGEENEEAAIQRLARAWRWAGKRQSFQMRSDLC